MLCKGRWNFQLIRAIFHPSDAEAILSLPLPNPRIKDKVLYYVDSYGKLFVKKVYNQLSSISSRMINQRINWKHRQKLKSLPRLLLLEGKIALNALPTRENFLKRGVITDGSCLLCNSKLESIFHLFISCLLA